MDTLRQLIEKEDEHLASAEAGDARPRLELEVGANGLADEPWVTFVNRDYFGLALSGGGVRSATFNLGLLQALSKLKLLEHVHYLSTVSGGGYIGGFLTAVQRKLAQDIEAAQQVEAAEQRADGARAGAPLKPDAALKVALGANALKENDCRESAPIRHLREFSRFLMPRVGFMQGETWDGIIAVLGGALPSMIACASLLVGICWLWSFLSQRLHVCSPYLGALMIALAMMALHVFTEAMARSRGKIGKGGEGIGHFIWLALFSSLVAAASWLVLFNPSAALRCGVGMWRGDWREHLGEFHTLCSADAELGSSAAMSSAFQAAVCPSVALGLAAFALLAVRGLASRVLPVDGLVGISTGLDRATARCIIPALVWLLLATVWWLAGPAELPLPKVAGGLAVSGSVFGLLFSWLKQPVQETNASSLLRKVIRLLKPMLPQVAANVTVLLLLVLAAMLVRKAGDWGGGWLLPTTVCAVLLGVLLLFDPARVGLHDFYRSRIARCYLGAARATTGAISRATTEQPDDDFAFAEARHSRPLHLVCCAANHLGGDTLSTLYRGARSAVVSPLGASVGGLSGELPTLRMSSALTASAAAFNSQMGSISMGLGPAVTFLMCVLNLRLGLWVAHPRKPDRWRRFLPGWYFFLEVFGLTRADANAGRLHLSDGGHFENLALYELVRRHCRYVIVSDSGADPDVKFDDIANATRRIREDFGVEIELDLAPLNLGPDGRSRQHAVIGTIHYDGLAGNDKGMILYFKPTLTGDEPTDITQYHGRNVDFPHESTGDQFYDEAQWESYRRLGEHSAQSVLGFLNKRRNKDASFVENAFLAAGQRWHCAPEDLNEVFLQLTERCAALETDIRLNAPASFRAEFFPEVAEVLGQKPPAESQDPDEVGKVLQFLLLICQVMEDAWVGAQLDRYWSHPLNEGWMNYFQRWASTPSFRLWWPILRPTYSDGFREFVKERFDLRLSGDGRDGPREQAHLTLSKLEPSKLGGFAVRQWQARYGDPELGGKQVLQYELSLGAASFKPIQVGFLVHELTRDDQVAVWNASALFVPHALMGAGIVARFLDAVIRHFSQLGCHELRVVIDAVEGRPEAGTKEQRREQGNRQAMTQAVNFYKSRYFVYRKGKDGASPAELTHILKNGAQP